MSLGGDGDRDSGDWEGKYDVGGARPDKRRTRFPGLMSALFRESVL